MSEEAHSLDEVVGWYIQAANEHGLVAEVVYFALKYMKNNPESSIEDAMNYGYNEWVK
jgi:hypothetical protein